MTKSLSLYLDVVRFIAAVAVLFAHLALRPFTNGFTWLGTNLYGEIAVAIFFVLSGYVISHVSSQRERDAHQYVAARIGRLYSVVLIALALTVVLDSIGMVLNESFYSDQRVLWKPPSVTGYLASLLFVNEFQVFRFGGISPGTNGVYWSLSFEATYYAAAGLILFARPLFGVTFAIVLMLVAGRTITALFPLWLLGFFLYRLNTLPRLSAVPSISLVIISATAVLLSPWLIGNLPSGNFGYYFPWGRGAFNRNLVGDYIAAILFGLHLLAVKIYLFQRSLTISRDSFIRWLGGLTFPMYLLHYPVITFLSAISPWSNDTKSHLAFLTLGVIFTVIALTPLCDWLKVRIRTHILSLRVRPSGTDA
jgi:peptidoglycan/LPS O-acetylase OafA/YrhL